MMICGAGAGVFYMECACAGEGRVVRGGGVWDVGGDGWSSPEETPLP